MPQFYDSTRSTFIFKTNSGRVLGQFAMNLVQAQNEAARLQSMHQVAINIFVLGYSDLNHPADEIEHEILIGAISG